MSFWKQFCIYALAIAAFSSCTSSKNLVYFNNSKNEDFNAKLTVTEAPFQVNDILSINISSLNPKASEIFNANTPAETKATTSTGSSSQISGYLINTDGFIQLPVLGNFKAAGITKSQLKKAITDTILHKKLLLDPVVEIRHLNFEVTVLGEVEHPTVITVPSEKISLVKALGLAGDLTIFGIRTNILLIREENGKRITRQIDITQKDFMTSPYYYLRPNDVIYVQPNKAKIASSTRSQQILPIVITGLSAAIIILDRVIK